MADIYLRARQQSGSGPYTKRTRSSDGAARFNIRIEDGRDSIDSVPCDAPSNDPVADLEYAHESECRGEVDEEWRAYQQLVHLGERRCCSTFVRSIDQCVIDISLSLAIAVT